MQSHDDMPTTVCEECVFDISRSFYFRRQCIESDSTLLSMLGIDCEVDYDTKPNIITDDVKDIVCYTIKNEDPESCKEYSDDEIDIKENYNQESASEYPDNIVYSVTEVFNKRNTTRTKQSKTEIQEFEYYLSEDENTQVKQQKQDLSFDSAMNKYIKDLNIDEEDEDLFYQLYNSDNEDICFTDEPTNIFECNVCSGIFASKNDLSEHLDTHDIKSNFICNICNREFQRKQDLINHFKYHDPRIINHCFYCGKKMKNIEDLKVHLNEHKMNDNDLKFTCYFCGNGYRTMALCQVC